MRIGLCAWAAVFALAGTLRAQVLEFDQGVDAAAISSSLRAEIAQGGGPQAPLETQERQRFWSKQCARFQLGPADRGVGEVRLRSTQYERVCRSSPWRETCEERAVALAERGFRISFGPGRMLEPWETEEFRACLEGTAFAFTVVQGAHAYRIETAGEEARLTPMGKLATEPDPEGLEVASFHSTGGSLEMVLRDRWASRYSGDRTVLRAELRRGSLGFDPVLWKGELALEPGAELHTVRFDWLASTLGRRLEPGAEYDVAWGFKRLGAVSLGTFVDRGRTPKVAYLAPLAGGNR